MNTKSTLVTKDQFVALLRDSGLTDAQMATLHRLFEARHPEAHAAFLRGLQLEEPAVAAIRAQSR